MVTEVLDGERDFEGVRDEWQTLFDDVEDAPWCALPEVFRAWTQVLRPRGQTRILAVRDSNGILRGVMPIMFDWAWRGPSAAPRFDYDPRDKMLITRRRPRPIPVRQLSTMASLPATTLWVGALCRAEETHAVARAIAVTIRSLPGWDVAILPAMEGLEETCWREAFSILDVAAVRTQKLGRVVRNLRGLKPFDDIVAGQKQKFRQNVRRASAAAKKVGIDFVQLEGTQEVSSYFGEIERVARASWKHEGREGQEVHLSYTGEQQAFIEYLLGSERLEAVPALCMARDSDGVLAVLLMLRHGVSVTALLTFWNGRHANASPGLLMFGEAIDWAARTGARRFEFNATAHWVRYITDHSDVVCNLVVFAPTLGGRALNQLRALTDRLR
jgi:hypothetical protein